MNTIKSPNIAFDVDGTLIHQVGELSDTPRYEIISILNFFVNNGCNVFVWSGGGIDYAERWVSKLGLTNKVIVIEKGRIGLRIDIAFDDEDVKLGIVNIKV